MTDPMTKAESSAPDLTPGLVYENLRDAGCMVIFYRDDEGILDWYLTEEVSEALYVAVAWYVDLFAFLAGNRFAWCKECDELWACSSAATRCRMCKSKDIENIARTKNHTFAKEEA